MTAAAAPAEAPPRAAIAARLLGGSFAVLERDFLASTSRPRFLVLRSGIVGAVVAAAFLFLLAEVADSPWKTPAQAGAQLFFMMSVLVPSLVLLTGPALAADSIAGERSLETLTLVLAAPVRPFGLVLAKFLSRLGALLVPTLATLPVAAIGFLYGGVSESAFLDWLILLLGMAVMVTASGVLASSFAASVATAVLASYLIGVLVPAFEMAGIAWVWHEVLGRRTPPVDWCAHNPYFVWFAFGVRNLGFAGRGAGSLEFLGTALAASFAALVVAAWRVGREAHFEARRQTRARRPRPLRREDPVLDRALPSHPFARRGWFVWVALVVVSAGSWLPTAHDWDDEEILTGLNIGSWLAALYVFVRASQAFAAERQQGSLAILLTTPLRAGSILRSRLHGLLATGTLLLVAPVTLCVLGTVTGEIRWPTIFCWSYATAVLFVLLAALGLRVSASAPTAGKAVLFSVGGFFAGLAAHGLSLFALVLAFRRSDDEVAAVWGTLSPPAFVAVLTAVPEMAPFRRTEALSALSAFGWSVVCVLAAAWLLATAVRRLEWNRD